MDLTYPHGKEGPGLGNVAYRVHGVEWGDMCLHLNTQYDEGDPASYFVVLGWGVGWVFQVFFCFLFFAFQESGNYKSYYKFMDYI